MTRHACLTPAPGPAWHITTPRRRTAAAIAAAIPGTATTRTARRTWTARIPRHALAVTATTATAAALTVTLNDAPDAGPLILPFEPWTASDVLPVLPAQLPASGHLIVRDIRIHTLTGRTARYLIPAFTAT